MDLTVNPHPNPKGHPMSNAPDEREETEDEYRAREADYLATEGDPLEQDCPARTRGAGTVDRTAKIRWEVAL